MSGSTGGVIDSGSCHETALVLLAVMVLVRSNCKISVPLADDDALAFKHPLRLFSTFLHALPVILFWLLLNCRTLRPLVGLRLSSNAAGRQKKAAQEEIGEAHSVPQFGELVLRVHNIRFLFATTIYTVPGELSSEKAGIHGKKVRSPGLPAIWHKIT